MSSSVSESFSAAEVVEGISYALCLPPRLVKVLQRNPDGSLDVVVDGVSATLPAAFFGAGRPFVDVEADRCCCRDSPTALDLVAPKVDIEPVLRRELVPRGSAPPADWKVLTTIVPPIRHLDAPAALPLHRAAFARGSATKVLQETDAVPHAVVSMSVLTHCVGPYLMDLRCTLSQGLRACEAIESIKAPYRASDLPPESVPALRRVLVQTPSLLFAPRLPHLTSLTSVTESPHILQDFVALAAAPALTTLRFGTLDVGLLGAAPPLLRLTSLSVRGFGGGPGLGALSRWAPRLEELTMDTSPALEALLSEPTALPCLTRLGVTGAPSQIYAVLLARRWVELTVCLQVPVSGSSHPFSTPLSVEHLSRLRSLSVSASWDSGPIDGFLASLGLATTGSAPQLRTLHVTCFGTNSELEQVTSVAAPLEELQVTTSVGGLPDVEETVARLSCRHSLRRIVLAGRCWAKAGGVWSAEAPVEAGPVYQRTCTLRQPQPTALQW